MGQLAGFAFAAALIVSAVAGATGCAPGNGPSASSPVTSSSTDSHAQNLLQSCANATKAISSAHVLIDLKGKFDRLGQASVVDGNAQAHPLVLNGTVTYQNGQVAPLVIADNSVWVKQGGVWNEVGATSTLVPPAIIDPVQGLPDLLNSVESAQVEGSVSVDGVDTTRVVGTIPVNKAKALLPDASGPADLTISIRKVGDPVLVRAEIVLSANQSIVLTLTDWNVPVHVTSTPAQ